jgi:hypothetical protein
MYHAIAQTLGLSDQHGDMDKNFWGIFNCGNHSIVQHNRLSQHILCLSVNQYFLNIFSQGFQDKVLLRYSAASNSANHSSIIIQYHILGSLNDE